MEVFTENTVLKKEDLSDGSSPSSSSSKKELRYNNWNIRVIEYTDKIRKKLIMTAQMERLRELLDNRLQQCGWKKDIQNMLEAEIRKRIKKGTILEFQELYDIVRKKGRRLVPKEIQEEFKQKILECYETDFVDIDEPSIDPI